MILILKLTLAVSSDWKLLASVPTHTALCDFVVGKNYRLQDIQLSKITPGAIAPRKPSKARGDFPRTPFARSRAGPQSPTPFARVNL